MKIELKRIEYSARMSEETNCFTADLWVDGVKIGQTSNHGTGGCDNFWGDQAAYAAADAWCKANLPKWTMGDTTFDTDIEMHVGALLEEYLNRKDMKRRMKTHLLLVLPARPKSVFEVPVKKPHKPTDKAVMQPFITKYPGTKFLNTMPEDEAFAIYAKAIGSNLTDDEAGEPGNA